MQIHISFVLFSFGFLGSTSIDIQTIDTIPISLGRILATGYSPFSATTTVQLRGIFAFCRWFYGENFRSSIIFYSYRCFPQSTLQATTTCSLEGLLITSNLTIHEPLKNGQFNVRVDCSGLQKTLLNITVRNCTNNVGNQVIVRASSFTYNSSGEFACSNGGIMLYANESLVNMKSTQCLFSAKWSDENFVQCWSEPHAELIGVHPVFAGENLTLTCSVMESNPTPTNRYQFYVGHTASSTTHSLYNISGIKLEMNNMIVSCQSQNIYTKRFPNTGRSRPKLLVVYYSPKQKFFSNITCNWTVGESGECAVYFLSNPAPSRLELRKNGSLQLNEGQHHLLSSADSHTYVYRKNEVTLKDDGSYTLTVISKTFPDQKLNLRFDVVVSTTNDKFSAENHSVIAFKLSIISVVAIGVLLLLLFFLYFFAERRRKTSQSADTVAATERNRSAETKPQSFNSLQVQSTDQKQVNGSYDTVPSEHYMSIRFKHNARNSLAMDVPENQRESAYVNYE